MPVINDYEATAVCDCFVFYNCADRSASYPGCNGTYEEQKTETYAGKNRWQKGGFWTRYVQILRLSIMLN